MVGGGRGRTDPPGVQSGGRLTGAYSYRRASRLQAATLVHTGRSESAERAPFVIE
ncbi:hypothetical protein [Alloactinosynnema sp. L-07]|nr:hypothetical protein [Alloactinosynnema sp. L-07]